ncbi:hypothetical protein N7475_007952 [Penicillium sp. IBT 31633x]|nr:hypothetical protein N7475_007952 [Penicillium sp. IBT 31633x]
MLFSTATMKLRECRRLTPPAVLAESQARPRAVDVGPHWTYVRSQKDLAPVHPPWVPKAAAIPPRLPGHGPLPVELGPPWTSITELPSQLALQQAT